MWGPAARNSTSLTLSIIEEWNTTKVSSAAVDGTLKRKYKKHTSINAWTTHDNSTQPLRGCSRGWISRIQKKIKRFCGIIITPNTGVGVYTNLGSPLPKIGARYFGKRST
ncbi:hypothetical protein CDAR_416991 [Caerostris darwini]|uniref:Uncharacterized protein n=1 Tax=Caerostris darwini TaxID=1538125 RepID=A0AAV4X6U8_9ARAC|nr:hypothetical protein CDAR_416991 [Caerostris darwini]